MKVNKETLAKLRRLYYNLTGSEAVFDDYCFFNFWCQSLYLDSELLALQKGDRQDVEGGEETKVQALQLYYRRRTSL